MPTVSTVYSASVTHTLACASLASDVGLLAGRAGSYINQKLTENAMDAKVSGRVTTGTGPTAAKQIELWAYAGVDEAGNFNDAITGTDALKTLVNKDALRRLLVIPTTATANAIHYFGPLSIAQAFDGIIPVRWGLFIVQNTGAALHATAGNHWFIHYPVKFVSA